MTDIRTLAKRAGLDYTKLDTLEQVTMVTNALHAVYDAGWNTGYTAAYLSVSKGLRNDE